jgi:CheY-like chemotaxis protein
MTNANALESLLSKKVNILLVDDSVDVLMYLTELLRSPLINVITARSYEKASRAIYGFAFCWHAWVIDIDLGPGKNGLDILREHPRFPFAIVLSGLGSMSAAVEALRLGAINVMDKVESGFGKLLDEVVDVSTLGFVLQGRCSKNLRYFSLLRDPLIVSTKQWAEKAGITTRQLARICEVQAPITPGQYIALYNACRYLVKKSIVGIHGAQEEKSFAVECVDMMQQQDGKILQMLVDQPAYLQAEKAGFGALSEE